jgi:hypothetical protein
MMPVLRAILGVGGAALLVLGLGSVVANAQPELGLYLIGIGGAAVLIAFFERMRYRRDPSATDAPAAGWRRTDEVFVDPTTGVRTRVWVDPGSGQRDYRPDG